jgi:hypothetical protein
MRSTTPIVRAIRSLASGEPSDPKHWWNSGQLEGIVSKRLDRAFSAGQMSALKNRVHPAYSRVVENVVR